ncbi:maltokinase N-terminal cap-like domain-containing protein [Pseudactinotalea sp.]|uniref:maltokinase N-terminal cap-like domain-containing protein n=1 Tax=Pseudactinotalea sp. TaxID=1926260 RepID=UPI003B3A6C92
MTSPSPLPLDTLPDHLAAARWFGGKGRPFTVTSVTRAAEIRTDGEPRLVIDLVEVSYSDGAEPATERYQLPLSLYSHPQERLNHAFINWYDEGGESWVHAYDAIHDRDAMAAWLAAFAAVEPDGGAPVSESGPDGLVLRRLPGHELDPEAHSTPFSGEQSNSSVMFGNDSLMKVFRKLTPGVNPDIEIHDVLTRAGSDHVAALYGWAELGSGEGVLQLALLQQFLTTASDGFELALASVRNLFAEASVDPGGELAADQAGGDFADEAHRLGVALAEVHAALAEHFGREPVPPEALTALGDRMVARLDEAVTVVPQLAEQRERLRSTFAGVAGLSDVHRQRVHGDLHLGQTLRTVLGWKLVDFEGEPAKPLAERRQPDSPWRDVAGMLRSFDYAAHAVVMTATSADGTEDEDRDDRARAWVDRNSQAFLAGYLGDREPTSDEETLLRAYVADKAVYEAVYEARNRPGWLPIPLAALTP